MAQQRDPKSTSPKSKPLQLWRADGEPDLRQRGAPFQNPKFPIPTPLPPAIPPVLKVHGVPHPCSLSLPHSSTHPSSSPSSHSSPFPPPPPPPLEASVPVTQVSGAISSRGLHISFLALLHSFIWVKSCSRNVEGNGGWGWQSQLESRHPLPAVHSSG